MCETCAVDAAERAVFRGAAHLDEVKPNWRELVDVEILDIDDVTCCIAGQVFYEEASRRDIAGYSHWLWSLCPREAFAADFGFVTFYVGDTYVSDAVLRSAWIKHLDNF